MKYILLTLTLFIFPSFAQAMAITEIYFDAEGSDEGKEWVELYNDSSAAIDLSIWKFVEKDSQRSVHGLSFATAKGSRGGSIIPPDSFAILADDADQFLIDNPSYTGIVIDTVMSLPNYSLSRTTAFTVSLESGEVVSAEASYLPKKEDRSGYTWERQGLQSSTWGPSYVLGGTPGRPWEYVSMPSPNPIVVDIHLNEIVSNPVGSDVDNEWVELRSDSPQPVDISGWHLSLSPSGIDNSQRIADGTLIGSNNFISLVIESFTLSNKGSTIYLLNADREAVDSTQFPALDEGWSWALFPNGWSFTGRPSRDSENEYFIPATPIPSIKPSPLVSPTVQSNTLTSPKSTREPSPKAVPSSATSSGNSFSPKAERIASPKVVKPSSPKASPKAKKVSSPNPKSATRGVQSVVPKVLASQSTKRSSDISQQDIILFIFASIVVILIFAYRTQQGFREKIIKLWRTIRLKTSGKD